MLTDIFKKKNEEAVNQTVAENKKDVKRKGKFCI